MSRATKLPEGTTLDQACEIAMQASIDNPGKYITLFACFGIELVMKPRLDTHDPTDSLGDFYWLNGKQKKFTNAQYAHDWNNTPQLN